MFQLPRSETHGRRLNQLCFEQTMSYVVFVSSKSPHESGVSSAAEEGGEASSAAEAQPRETPPPTVRYVVSKMCRQKRVKLD